MFSAGSGTGSGFSFGGNNTASQAPNSTPAFSFGGSNNNTNAGQTNSLFGQPAQQQQQPATGGLFGQPAQQSQPAGGSLFGQNQQQQQQPAPGGLFGQNQQQQQQSASGGLFGQNQQQQQQPASGGLFGQNQQQQSSAPLFGGSSTFNKPAGTGTSLFGGGQAQTNTTAQPAATGSLFGGGAQASTTTTGGGLFGGAPKTNSLFGQNQPQQQTTSLFGQPQQPKPSLFGQNQQQQQQQQQQNSFSKASLFGQPQPQSQPQQQQQQQQSQLMQLKKRNNGEPSVLEQIEKLQRAWDPSSPQCAFQFFFYNRVGQQEALLYEKPARIEQSRWDDAISGRPDDTHVPALAIGFTDLQKRVSVQETAVAQYRKRMHEIDEKLAALSQRHDLHTTVKISQMKMRHRKLVHRTLALAARIQVLRSRGYVLRPDEEVLKKKLEQLHKEVDDPAVFGRINEIWARLTVLRERAKTLPSTGPGAEFNDLIADGAAGGLEGVAAAGEKVRAILSELDWNRDDDQLEKLAKVLKAQQIGIAYLAEILLRDTAQVEDIIDEITHHSDRSDQDKKIKDRR